MEVGVVLSSEKEQHPCSIHLFSKTQQAPNQGDEHTRAWLLILGVGPPFLRCIPREIKGTTFIFGSCCLARPKGYLVL